MSLFNAKEAREKSIENSVVYYQDRLNDFLITCELAIEKATKKGATEAIITPNDAWGLDWSERVLGEVERTLVKLGYEVWTVKHKEVSEYKLVIDWGHIQ